MVCLSPPERKTCETETRKRVNSVGSAPNLGPPNCCRAVGVILGYTGNLVFFFQGSGSVGQTSGTKKEHKPKFLSPIFPVG